MIDRVPVSDDDRPDIAVEVIWTSGGIDKLEVYRKLGVREVWFYERGTLRFFTLREERYAGIERSELLPGADPELFVRRMAAPSQSEAIQLLCGALRPGSGGS
jgi:Uma2 family endonuclease